MKTLKTRVTTFATALIIAATGISTTAITAYAATSYSKDYGTYTKSNLKSVQKATYYKGSSDDYMIATNTVTPTNKKKYYAYSEVKWKYKNIYGKWKWDDSDDASDYEKDYTTTKEPLIADALTTSWFERNSKWTKYFVAKFEFGKAKK